MEGNINPFQSPTNEEKTLSMICHLSTIMGGIILPIIIWAVQKEKSQFTRFHSLQAIWFHVLYFAVIIIFVFLFIGLVFIGLIGGGMMGAGGKDPGAEMSVFAIVVVIAFYIALFGLIIGVIAYSIYMAVKTYKGELIKYPIVGKIIYRKVYGEIPVPR
jgi:uncharacterized Tic20 family protein